MSQFPTLTAKMGEADGLAKMAKMSQIPTLMAKQLQHEWEHIVIYCRLSFEHNAWDFDN